MGQGISSTQFFVYGKKHFTRSGYQKHLAKYEAPVQDRAAIRVGETGADDVDLVGRVIVITGANSGVGKELATYAASKGAKVYMLCRSPDRAERAKSEIMQQTSNDEIHILLADVGELKQVRRVAKELTALEDRVDCLVCNAGVLLNDRRETSEGNEVTFASHFLGGSYLLSKLLLPQLKAASPKSRVVFVSSAGMYNTKFPSWDIATNTAQKNYQGNMAYAYSKRGQILLAERWARDYPDVKWVTGHPGWADTPAVDEAYGSMKKYLQPLRTPWEGSEGLAWLMSTETQNLKSGEFYLDRSVQRKHMGGPFMTEGSFTKNSEAEVDNMMENLEKACADSTGT